MRNTRPARKSVDIYEPRNPRKTHYFKPNPDKPEK
jgi:hypothetical protein